MALVNLIGALTLVWCFWLRDPVLTPIFIALGLVLWLLTGAAYSHHNQKIPERDLVLRLSLEKLASVYKHLQENSNVWLDEQRIDIRRSSKWKLLGRYVPIVNQYDYY